MKLTITEPGYPDIEPLEIDLGCRAVALREVYNGIGIETDQGRFGIAERDGGIEILLNGELIWSSTEYIDAAGELAKGFLAMAKNSPTIFELAHHLLVRRPGDVHGSVLKEGKDAGELEPKDLAGGTIVDENGKKVEIPPELEEVARRHAEWDGKSPHPYGCDGGEGPDDYDVKKNLLSCTCSLCGHQMGTAARPIGGIEETTGKPICERCRVQVDGDPWERYAASRQVTDGAGAVLEEENDD